MKDRIKITVPQKSKTELFKILYVPATMRENVRGESKVKYVLTFS